MSALEMPGHGLWMLHLRGGGADICCTDCLGRARADHDGSVISVAKIDPASDRCYWCGWELEQ